MNSLAQPLSAQGLSQAATFRPRPIKVEEAVVPPQPGLDWAPEATGFEESLLLALNSERAKVGCSPLVLNAYVQSSAVFYARMMATYLFMSHDTPDGIPGYPAMSWVTRIQLFGSPPNAAIGENLAYGFIDVASVVAAWMSDAGHRDNILQPDYVGVGCGVARATNGLLFWDNDFTSERLGPTPPPVITSVVPASGKVGDSVIITGGGFDDGSLLVSFNGAKASSSHWTTSVYPTTIPVGATSGPLTVTSRTGTASVAFVVSNGPPPPLLPVPGSHWINKSNGNVVTIRASTTTLVSYSNKSGKIGSLKLSAFLKRFSLA